jgi:hypothetical protein
MAETRVGYRRRVHRDFEPGPYAESLAKLCAIHNLANFPIFPPPSPGPDAAAAGLFHLRSYFADSAQNSVVVY